MMLGGIYLRVLLLILVTNYIVACDPANIKANVGECIASKNNLEKKYFVKNYDFESYTFEIVEKDNPNALPIKIDAGKEGWVRVNCN